MKYHNITKADMLNGEGLRVVLWVSGCSHHCPACQNAFTWDENDGVNFDDDAINEIYKELEADWCNGITLSGGDPLFLKNRKTIRDLVINIRTRYPEKTIWSYTGYTWEELMEQLPNDEYLKDILENIDVLAEGRFVLSLASVATHYVGSTNQRIIDVPKSLKKDKIVIYKEKEDI
ncbi:MAG: anaerobic ribonucleoside-triphosphate reductase activating protein [Firmicutes bacterium]|nr:anaerobic ribonucleoside-triphosphate reductase activating protein [Bacillota bacterium]